MQQLQRFVVCVLALNLLTSALCRSLPDIRTISGRTLSRHKRQYGDMMVNQHLGDNWLKHLKGCKTIGCGISITDIGRRKRDMASLVGTVAGNNDNLMAEEKTPAEDSREKSLMQSDGGKQVSVETGSQDEEDEQLMLIKVEMIRDILSRWDAEADATR